MCRNYLISSTSTASHKTSLRPHKRVLRIVCNSSPHSKKVVVIGAGAAGLTASYFAARSGASVTLYEKTNESGKKILISGGTRCNILPASTDYIDSFTTESSKSALRAIFRSWSLEECQDWLVSDVGIQLTLEKETLKLFPTSNSAKEVRDKLVKACLKAGVKFEYDKALTDIHSTTSPDGSPLLECTFKTANNTTTNTIQAERVILSTGGKSFPTLGTDGIGYIIAERLGHTIRIPYPALTPLLASNHPGGHQLAGLSMYDVKLTATTKKEKKVAKKQQNKRDADRSAVLCTHRGYSGPAILDLSQNVTREYERNQPEAAAVLTVNWQQDKDRTAWEAILQSAIQESGNTLVTSLLSKKQGLPNRLTDALLTEAAIPLDRKVSELRKAERLALLDVLTAYELAITGHEGYPKAEVTGGGIPLEEIDCSCMQSRVVPGLYVAGEVCDVHGRIGGFNFLWAWVSGRLAGIGAVQ